MNETKLHIDTSLNLNPKQPAEQLKDKEYWSRLERFLESEQLAKQEKEQAKVLIEEFKESLEKNWEQLEAEFKRRFFPAEVWTEQRTLEKEIPEKGINMPKIERSQWIAQRVEENNVPTKKFLYLTREEHILYISTEFWDTLKPPPEWINKRNFSSFFRNSPVLEEVLRQYPDQQKTCHDLNQPQGRRWDVYFHPAIIDKLEEKTGEKVIEIPTEDWIDEEKMMRLMEELKLNITLPKLVHILCNQKDLRSEPKDNPKEFFSREKNKKMFYFSFNDIAKIEALRIIPEGCVRRDDKKLRQIAMRESNCSDEDSDRNIFRIDCLLFSFLEKGIVKSQDYLNDEFKIERRVILSPNIYKELKERRLPQGENWIVAIDRFFIFRAQFPDIKKRKMAETVFDEICQEHPEMLREYYNPQNQDSPVLLCYFKQELLSIFKERFQRRLVEDKNKTEDKIDTFPPVSDKGGETEKFSVPEQTSAVESAIKTPETIIDIPPEGLISQEEFFKLVCEKGIEIQEGSRSIGKLLKIVKRLSLSESLQPKPVYFSEKNETVYYFQPQIIEIIEDLRKIPPGWTTYDQILESAQKLLNKKAISKVTKYVLPIYQLNTLEELRAYLEKLQADAPKNEAEQQKQQEIENVINKRLENFEQARPYLTENGEFKKNFLFPPSIWNGLDGIKSFAIRGQNSDIGFLFQYLVEDILKVINNKNLFIPEQSEQDLGLGNLTPDFMYINTQKGTVSRIAIDIKLQTTTNSCHKAIEKYTQVSDHCLFICLNGPDKKTIIKEVNQDKKVKVRYYFIDDLLEKLINNNRHILKLLHGEDAPLSNQQIVKIQEFRQALRSFRQIVQQEIYKYGSRISFGQARRLHQAKEKAEALARGHKNNVEEIMQEDINKLVGF